MKIQIDSSVITLFHFIDSGPYDALVELIWKTNNQIDLDSYFETYSDVLSIETNEKTKYESKLQSFNTALYFRREVLPSLIQAGDIQLSYMKAKENIDKYKYIWANLVEKYLKKDVSVKKFILKHYEESSKSKNKKEFISYYLKIVKDWSMDKDSLLSQFYYIDDLQANQKKVILLNEPIYIFLYELFNNPEALYLQDILLTIQNKENINLATKKGGKMPNLILQDGIFRVEPFKILSDSPNTLERENDFVSDFNNELKIITPKNFENKDIQTKFDSSIDVIYQGRFELATLTAIFQIGEASLIAGNSISFTLDEICEKLGVESATWAYQRIVKAIFYMSINLFSVKISQEKERIFHIVSAIEKPIYNSERQKEWTVEIDPFLRDNILKNLYTELFASQLAGYSYESTALLFKTLILDAQQHNLEEPKEYTLSSLSQRMVLTGKPIHRKKKIINSLNELVSAQKSGQKIVEKFDILDNGNKFLVYFSKIDNNLL